MVDFHFSGKQIVKVKINCYFLDQVREGSGGGGGGRGGVAWRSYVCLPLTLQMRLVSPPINEQSFHIFYQILAGLTSEERGKILTSVAT